MASAGSTALSPARLRVLRAGVLLAACAVARAGRAQPASGAPPAPAPPSQETTASALAGISLEELLDTVVWVASRRDEPASAAPASITAYTDEDIRALGYYTIYDLANITPGWSGSVMYGEKVLETRGQKAGSFNNNKHLVYVDGIPVSHARNYRAPVDEELPLFFAHSVEFLRGPASALYGTSAFFGVVNVVPMQLDGDGSAFRLRLSAGSRDAERRLGGGAVLADNAGTLRLALGYYDKDASRAFVGPTRDPANLLWDDQKSLFLNASYALEAGSLAGVGLGLIYLRKNGGLGESWLEQQSTHRLNDLTWETIIPYLKLRRSLGERARLESYLLYNTGRETGWWTSFSGARLGSSDGNGAPLFGYDTQVDAVQADGQLRLAVTAHTDVTVGANIDTRRQRGESRSYSFRVNAEPGPPFVEDPALMLPSDRYTIYSAFAQLRQEVPLLAGLILTLGAREDVGVSPRTSYRQLSPRAGLVQRITEQLNVKAFYGSALRAPGIKEIGLNQETRQNLERMGLPAAEVPELEAETIRSLELGPTWSSGRASAAVTAFHNRTARALDGTQLSGLQIFRNSAHDITAVGGEAQLLVAPWPGLRLLGNYSWARARTPQLVDGALLRSDVEDVPVRKVNGALMGTLRRLDVHLGAVVRWVDRYRVVVGGGERPPGSLTVDGNLIWGAARLLRSKVPIDLELQVRNLLDNRAMLPKHGLPDVPLPGRRFMLTLACGS